MKVIALIIKCHSHLLKRLEIDVKTPVTSSSLRLSSNYTVQSTFTVHDSALKEKVGYDERTLRNTTMRLSFLIMRIKKN